MLYLFGLEEFITPDMGMPTDVPSLTLVLPLSPWYQEIDDVEEELANIDQKVDGLAAQIASVQTALGEATELDIQVKDFQSEDVKDKDAGSVKRFVILLKANGIPKEGGIITSIDAVVDGGDMSLVPIDGFTATELGSGLYALEVPLADSLDGVKVLFIQAFYTEGSDTIYGSKLFTVGLHTE